MSFNGAYGDIKDPEATIDAGFDNAHKSSSTGDDKEKVSWKGSPVSVKPDGLDGALMKCQTAHITEETQSLDMPICVWADHSTYGVVNGFDLTASKTGAGIPQDQVSAFGTELRGKARVKA
jgi:hypothetical protein